MVDNKRIFLASPHMSEEGFEEAYIKEAFNTNWIAPLGENVNKFEEELVQMVGAKSGAALSSGTAAIHMALKAAGVGTGDIVFCQSLTFAATVNPVIYQGAIPVFIDSDRKTWNMSAIALEKAIRKYPQAKAVLLVNLYGLCADMERIAELCKENQLLLIEDAAESLGSTYHGKWTGTFGEYGIFSFNGNKIITTSGGGMLVSNAESDEVAEERMAKVRFWATQAREPARFYQHKEIGYNYRMSNVLAGIGRGQLKVLKSRVDKKRHIFRFYQQTLRDLKGIEFMPMLEETKSNCWLSVIQIDRAVSKITPDQIMDALADANIESRPVWKPLHLQPVFKRYDFVADINDDLEILDVKTGADNSVAGILFANGLCLPSDTKMTDDDLGRICTIIRGLWRRNEIS